MHSIFFILKNKQVSWKLKSYFNGFNIVTTGDNRETYLSNSKDTKNNFKYIFIRGV